MYVCKFVQVLWPPTVTRDGDWQDCDTQRIGDGGESGWITKKNQFLPYVCDLFGYIESFTHSKESNGRAKPLN